MMRLDDPKRAELNRAHADLRRRHFDDNVPATSWRMWRRYRQCDDVAMHLRRNGYAAVEPIAYIEWPGGWFVSLADERVLFVPVTWDRCCASFPLDFDIVEVTRA